MSTARGNAPADHIQTVEKPLTITQYIPIWEESSSICITRILLKIIPDALNLIMEP